MRAVPLADNPRPQPSEAPRPESEQPPTPPFEPDLELIEYEKKDGRPSDIEER